MPPKLLVRTKESEDRSQEEPSEFYIDMYSIGDADSFLLWKNTDFMLVDTGRRENAADIINLLAKREVDTLKALVITHYDSDHIGSYPAVIDYMLEQRNIHGHETIKHIYARKYTKVQLDILPEDRYRNYIRFINGILRYENRVEEEFPLEPLPGTDTVEKMSDELYGTGTGLWIFPYKGNPCGSFTLDSQVQIVWLNRAASYLRENSAPKQLAGQVNNDSLVFKAVYSCRSALFLGDMGQSGLRDLIQYNSFALNSDILKIAHHGHIGSSPEYFIAEVRPILSAVTTTLDSKPDNPPFLNRLEELTSNLINFGALIYSGDKPGDYTTIVIRTRELKIYAKNASVAPYFC